jgi:hypothetical protein
VAIHSRDEFDAVLSNQLLGLERVSMERPNNSALIQARRDLRAVSEAVKANQITKALSDKFVKASGIARSAANDPDVDEHFMDLEDFLTTRV